LATTSEGSSVVTDNKIEDPAIAISAGLAIALRARDSVQIVPRPLRTNEDDPARIAGLVKGTARYVLDVRTTTWNMMYFPTDWAHYQLMYAAKARLIDVDTGRVAAEAFCKQQPESNADAPTYELMLAHGAALLKAKMASAAEACTASLGRDMLGFQNEAQASAAAAARKAAQTLGLDAAMPPITPRAPAAAAAN
jgi:hypothetical protein